MSELTLKIAQQKLIKKLQEKGITDERVLDAFMKVPRHLFVDKAMYHQAYEDTALPIGFGQTISQPYIVALMTQLLNLKENEKILEIGTGSGFQTAILAQFSKRVYTIERSPELGETARKRLRELGYDNIVFRIGDGSLGWPGQSPFDKIIVTAGAPTVPQSLLEQLSTKGRLVIPTGNRLLQQLMVYEKTDKEIKQFSVEQVVFVPLIGENAWK
ncbi:MAG: protein-L-isoaspartate(D-aspartate) O-methyltransferase [Chitinispirillaceae bacterium]|nr:protein-L-isoaspartate(D-aspartate) O-methyltransferase [Chitinispirillaceae bacterium]